jgi:hypothetical protein
MKAAGWIVAAFAIGLCALLGWRLADGAAVLERLGTEANRFQLRSAMALDVVRDAWIGRPEADLADFASRKKQQGWLVKSHDDVVELDDLVFRVREQRVVGVYFAH